MSFDMVLCDINARIAEAWESRFQSVGEVKVVHGSIFEVQADALVSPANSFGFMNGGLDGAISRFFRGTIQVKVQRAIREKHYGELPIGQAEIVPTDFEHFPYLICAPTMRIPQDVSKTLNAYLAFRAVLMAALAFNRSQPGNIRSIACPGLGTAVGNMAPDICAIQMRAAWENIIRGNIYRYTDLAQALQDEVKLMP